MSAKTSRQTESKDKQEEKLRDTCIWNPKLGTLQSKTGLSRRHLVP